MKKLGQHFLKNKSALRLISGSLEITASEVVIEIGPGHGELTDFLAATSALKIIAIEKDENLYRAFVEKFKANDRITAACGDALEILPVLTRGGEFKTQNYKIVGNIPYYITGHLFRILSELERKPEQCLFTIQKEVALRICAEPPRMNRLAASVQFWANAKIIKTLPASDFNPPPKVSSAIISLETILGVDFDSASYYAAVRGIFAQPRKMLVNNLSKAIGWKRESTIEKLSSINIIPGLRPQDLSVSDIINIAKTFF
jgi:16S rRNA (adenine1518-N6/adenine1519-N6)-dimethyltransferase